VPSVGRSWLVNNINKHGFYSRKGGCLHPRKPRQGASCPGWYS
jgi:hypothetical protein